MKLNDVLKNNKVEVYGFKAFKDLEKLNNKIKKSCVVISTISPALMSDLGITSYFAPVIPRNSVYNTAEDVIDADLRVQWVSVLDAVALEPEDEVIICSRHAGTIDILQNMYPNNITISDEIVPDDIVNKNVVGTLPANMVQYCNRYQGVVIKDFDYSKDSDLFGEILKERMIITKTISVVIKDIQS